MLFIAFSTIIGTVYIGSVIVFGASSQLSPFEPERKLPNFDFVTVGDMGCSSITSKIVNDMTNMTPELVLALGDLSYQNSADCWLKIVSPIESKIKIILGEHDHKSSSLLEQFKNLFNLSQEYYSFNYQYVHFIALATEIPFDINSPQYNFIKNDLEDASKNSQIKWIIVYSYRPSYSSPTKHQGNANLRDIYHPLFQKYHVDIVLQAHNHNYQRSYPINYNQRVPSNPTITDNDSNLYKDSIGQVYVTIGTGGAKLYDLSGKAPYIATQHNGFGFLDISLTNNGRNLTGIFYSTNNRSIEDIFTVLK